MATPAAGSFGVRAVEATDPAIPTTAYLEGLLGSAATVYGKEELA